MVSFLQFMQIYENHYDIDFANFYTRYATETPLIVDELANILQNYSASKITPLANILAKKKRMLLCQHRYICVYIYENIISLGQLREPLRLYFLEFIDSNQSPAFHDLHIQIDSVCFAYQTKVDLPIYINTLLKNATLYLT